MCGAVAAVFVAYAALYWYHVIAAAMPFDAQFAYFVGSCSVICMVLGLLLSARPRAVETAFGGLDRMYGVHKYLGVAALLLFIAHFATVPGGPPEGEAAAAGAVSVEGGAATAVAAEAAGQDADEGEEEEEELPIDLLGLIAMIGFTLLIIVTLNRKIPYHRWITSHRFMGLFFVVAAVHVFLVLYDGEELALLSPPGVALAVLLLAGLVAYGYKQLLYPRKEKHAFTLSAVNRLDARDRGGAGAEEGRNVPLRAGAVRLRHHRRGRLQGGASLHHLVRREGGRAALHDEGARRLHPPGARRAGRGRRCRHRGTLRTVQSSEGSREAGVGRGGDRDHALPVGPAHDGTGARQDHPALLLRARGAGGAVLRRDGGARGRGGRGDDHAARPPTPAP